MGYNSHVRQNNLLKNKNLTRLPRVSVSSLKSSLHFDISLIIRCLFVEYYAITLIIINFIIIIIIIIDI